MFRLIQLLKCISMILLMSATNIALAGSDRGYMNLTMNKHMLPVNKQNQKQITSAILQKVGQYDGKNKCYRTNIKEHQFCFNPINYIKTGAGDNDIFLMAFSGYEMTGKYGTGIFFVMDYTSNEYTKGLEFRSINGFYGVGTPNQPITKDQVKLIEISGETFAWQIKDGFTGQGETLEKTIFIYETGMSDIPLKKIFEIDSYYDNEGLCDPQQKIKCQTKEITLKLIQNPNVQKANDIELNFTLKEDNKIIKTSNDLIKFNDQANSYLLPSKDMMKYMEDKAGQKLGGAINPQINSNKNQTANYTCTFVREINNEGVPQSKIIPLQIIDGSQRGMVWSTMQLVDVVKDVNSGAWVGYSPNKVTTIKFNNNEVNMRNSNSKIEMIWACKTNE